MKHTLQVVGTLKEVLHKIADEVPNGAEEVVQVVIVFRGVPGAPAGAADDTLIMASGYPAQEQGAQIQKALTGIATSMINATCSHFDAQRPRKKPKLIIEH